MINLDGQNVTQFRIKFLAVVRSLKASFSFLLVGHGVQYPQYFQWVLLGKINPLYYAALSSTRLPRLLGKILINQYGKL